MLPKVPEWRLNRLLYHLWKVEKEIGPLEKPDYEACDSCCPITRYAPLRDKRGRCYLTCGYGWLAYQGKAYKIYDPDDQRWWDRLTPKSRLQVLRWLDELLFNLTW